MAQEPGMHCYYMGNSYPLYITVDETKTKASIKYDGKSFTFINPTAVEVDVEDALKSFYIKELHQLIRKRIELYQPNFSVKHKSFAIKDSKTKWGSCNSKMQLTFNWRLMMYPLEAIDYVVIHELCHLIHMNHGRSFWRLVGKVQPNYKEVMAILGNKTKSL
ncbi:MAG: hypothetical protein A2Y18_06685 [Clostridiales bacterium GWD2_32_19]|nr:MAG: hypothetical protein A2Y18_06685 [Clostridiales bacterium GWD2_32_19]